MEKIQVHSVDGIELKCRFFQSKTASHKIVLIAPATGVKKHLYQAFAEFLTLHGFSVMTWDWRGIAENLNVHVKDDFSIMEDWAKKDLNAMIQWVGQYDSDAQIFAVGHSFGGQAFGLASEIDKIKAIVTVAAQSGYWKHWPISLKFQFAALWYAVMPLCTHALGYFPSRKFGLGENLPKGVALQWAAWCRNPAYMGDYRGHEKMTQPLLCYWFEDDHFAPKAAVLALHQHYSQCVITFKEISPSDLNVQSIGHFGFFKNKAAMTLWLEVIDFFNTAE